MFVITSGTACRSGSPERSVGNDGITTKPPRGGGGCDGCAGGVEFYSLCNQVGRRIGGGPAHGLDFPGDHVFAGKLGQSKARKLAMRGPRVFLILCYNIRMNWALKRQILDVIILILFIAGFAFLIIYPKVNRPPTCYDGKQNGDETGVDCGGACERACLAEQEGLAVVWARAFKVIPGRYNAVAYITNHNKDAAIKKINYRFRFGDKNNIYIGKRDGVTFIPPGGSFAVFEPAIDVGNSIPVYTTFEFTETPQWLQVPQRAPSRLQVLVSDIVLSGEDARPRLSAQVSNSSLYTLKNLIVVAILHEASGNALAVSRTILDELKPLEKRNIYFTWPEPLSAPVVEKEIIPIFDIFSAKLE